MMFNSLIRRLGTNSRSTLSHRWGGKPARRRPQRRHVLRCEPLESRLLLSLVTWDGDAGDGLWNTAANWSTDVVPGANDDVTIDVAGDVTITFSGANYSIKSLENAENLVISSSGSFTVSGTANNSGTLEVQAGSVILQGDVTSSGSFEVAAGASLSLYGTVNPVNLEPSSRVTGAGNVGFNGNATIGSNALFGGVYNVSGSTGVSGGGTADFTGATVQDVGQTLSVYYEATADFTGSNINVTTLNLGRDTGDTSTTLTVDNLTVSGAFTWVGGTLAADTTTIAPGATLELNNFHPTRYWVLDGGILENNGTTLLRAPQFVTELELANGAVFNNAGTFIAENVAQARIMPGGDGYGEVQQQRPVLEDHE